MKLSEEIPVGRILNGIRGQILKKFRKEFWKVFLNESRGCLLEQSTKEFLKESRKKSQVISGENPQGIAAGTMGETYHGTLGTKDS